MSAERKAEIEQRAQVHAALADPARLRIVDHLSLGDASPKELQVLLGMPSNLIAHHLQVLERVALITRRRSEADRRRSYLRLMPDALDGLLPHGSTVVPRVVFVCTANSARSQLAAALWARSSDVPVASAGTHPADQIARGAVEVARRHDLRLAGARPRPLSDVIHGDDFVITVCDNAHEELAGDDSPAKVRAHWSVSDPVRSGNPSAYDAAFDDIARRVTDLAPRLTAS
jgi:protein-tyrosine-phosphatase/DNA-binding transcriptional ArsR family regulator